MSLLCQDLHLDSLRTFVPNSSIQTSLYRSLGLHFGEFLHAVIFPSTSQSLGFQESAWTMGTIAMSPVYFRPEYQLTLD